MSPFASKTALHWRGDLLHRRGGLFAYALLFAKADKVEGATMVVAAGLLASLRRAGTAWFLVAARAYMMK